MIVGSDTYHTGLSMDLECNDVRRIEQLVGKEWHDTSKDCNIGSFYLDGWRESRESRVRVHGMRGTILDVEMEVLVDVIDSYIDPDPPLRRIHVRAELEFNGIAVSSYSVQSEPDDEKLMNIARQLFDVSAFAPPVRSEEKLSDGRHYVDLKFFPPA